STATRATKTRAAAKKTIATKAPANKTTATKATGRVTPRRTAPKPQPTPAEPQPRRQTPEVVPQHEDRWGARPHLARLVRLVALAIPVAASIGAAALCSRIVPRPTTMPATIAWWVGITAVATLVLAAVDRIARRLLPLATLLRLSILFPDPAPSR